MPNVRSNFRVLRYLLLLTLALPLVTPGASAEVIKSFDSDIYIENNGSVTVIETIHYDFEGAYRHGIYRDIPVKYEIGGKYHKLWIDVIEVTDQSGEDYQYKTTKNGGRLNIRIGDPDRTITGLHVYKIVYRVDGAITFFETEDEFYWNVTGDEWRVPILSASADVELEDPNTEGLRAKCFTGRLGSTQQDCSYRLKQSGASFESLRQLPGGHGLTLVLGFPKGSVSEPSGLARAIRTLRDNWSLGIPALALLFLGFMWRSSGRDPETSGVIAVRYDPPGELTPAEAGTLIDEQVDILDITSTIIDLAVRGYLKIEEVPSTKYVFFSSNDYKLIKVKEPTQDELKYHEEIVFSGIFKHGTHNVMVSDLKNKFYKEIPSIQKALYNELVGSKLFPTNPDHVRQIYKWIGYGLVVLGMFVISMLWAKLSILATGIIFIIFSRYMPRKTKRGAKLNEEILGFREFIERAEKGRIEKLAKDDPTLFDRILPYAIVFDLSDRWADAFSDVYTTPPNWYHSASYNNMFSPRIFVGDLGRSLSVMNNSLRSTPRKSGGSGFGGGGFSGGGFGGGGGGSW